MSLIHKIATLGAVALHCIKIALYFQKRKDIHLDVFRLSKKPSFTGLFRQSERRCRGISFFVDCSFWIYVLIVRTKTSRNVSS